MAAGLAPQDQGVSPSSAQKAQRLTSASHLISDSSMDLSTMQSPLDSRLQNMKSAPAGLELQDVSKKYKVSDGGASNLGVIVESHTDTSDCRHTLDYDSMESLGTGLPPPTIDLPPSPMGTESGACRPSSVVKRVGVFSRLSTAFMGRDSCFSDASSPTGRDDIEASKAASEKLPRPPAPSLVRMASRNVHDSVLRSFVSGKKVFDRAASLPRQITTKITSDEAYAHVVSMGSAATAE